ncbi:MAG TPA: type II toxin-antitoxin system VapC family toxin [Terracidiphilus sp.]|nr:type II toxin-antitoxin system VapC family toxin [Terracidiphilus sp.]
MTFLLDTHFVIWIPINDRRIGSVGRKILNDSANTFLFSAANLWEIAIKRAQKVGAFAYDPRAIRKHMLANGYQELPIDGSHAVAVDSLPLIHRDPFDRLLIAQAIIEGITFLTRDRAIAKYPGPIRRV